MEQQTLTIIGNADDKAMQACEALMEVMAERNALILEMLAALKAIAERIEDGYAPFNMRNEAKLRFIIAKVEGAE